MTAPALHNDTFQHASYHRTPIAAQAIAELLTAGLPPQQQSKPFVLFTGGGNGTGKSTFLSHPLDRELRLKGFALRNMEVFYETVCRLHDSGEIMASLTPEQGTKTQRGQAYWEQMTALFPELDELRLYRVPMLNMDMVAELLNECIAHKQADPNWLVRDHYYRALEHAPELCEALAHTSHSFVVDSTMSKPDKITQAAKATAEAGYDLHYAIFYAKDAPQRVMERAQQSGRRITETDARRSQRKTPNNFDTFVQSAHENNGFLGLYDTSHKTCELIAHNGHQPMLGSLNPLGVIEAQEAPLSKRLITRNWQAFEDFRFTGAQIPLR
jgi:predicted ABC-type ATPase